MEVGDVILKEVVREGFGHGLRFVSFKKYTSDDKSAYQFASSLNKGIINLEVDVLIKRQPQQLYKRQLLMSDWQFHNEVLMYQELLPLIGASHFAPVMYWGRATGGEEPDRDIIVLSYLKEYSVHRCNSVYLDLNLLKSLLAKLGHFHALSYNAKGRGLKESASKLKIVGFSTRSMEEHGWWLKEALMRGITPLLPKPEYKETLEKLIEKFENLPLFVKYLESYEETTAVLCHGDFCSNNVVFKYNDDDVVEDIKFVDFQTSKYASPSVDLSFFLFLNTSAELRATSWDDLLETYLNSLFDNLTNSSVAPTRQQILEEFSRRVIYGYLHSSFFLPIMLSGRNGDDDWEGDDAKELGGPECTEPIVNIMKHLLDKGYIDALLKNYPDS